MNSEVHLVVPYSIRESIIVTTTSIKYVVKAVVSGPADLLFISTVLHCHGVGRSHSLAVGSSGQGSGRIVLSSAFINTTLHQIRELVESSGNI